MRVAGPFDLNARTGLRTWAALPRFDPLWDGPRLLPTFAAQLIGQAMLDRRDPAACVETAYGRIGAPRKALLLDRKS
jgi:hypothetical protein